MAKGTGPLKGVRVPVKLPWKSAALDEDQYVSVKKPVVEFLKFDIAKDKDLEYKGKIFYKDKKDGESTGNLKSKDVKKLRRPGFRQRSIKVIFGDKKTGKKKKVTVGGKSVYSISFPVTKGILMSDIREEFMTGKWKGLSVIRIENMDTGQGYPIY